MVADGGADKSPRFMAALSLRRTMDNGLQTTVGVVAGETWFKD